MAYFQTELLVVGGGINGVGIARDAAGRGISVHLVEQDDLAQHTSAASTKLIHGGLRYLEYFEFRLVAAALRERERFLTLAPHLVHPMEFVLPHVNSPRPSWMISLGLALYDHLGGRSRLPRSQRVKISTSRYREGLQAHVDRGFTYPDCLVDDSRLVVLNALDAVERGAVIRTRTRLVDASRDANGWRCTLVDTATGAASTLWARVIVNAGGPWVTQVLQHCVHVNPRHSVRLVKGSHIVVPRLYDAEHAFMLQNPDRRIVFVTPYEEQYSLIGTTELPVATPGPSPPITSAEVDYLCDSANRYFRRQLTARDVVWSFSGTRPLFEDASKNATAVTRDYVLDLDAPSDLAPVLSVFGGKITTYRKLAEHALRKLAGYFPDAAGEWTANAALPGGDIPSTNIASFIEWMQHRFPFLSASLATRLGRAYGTRAPTVLRGADTAEQLGAHFGAGLYEAEVEYLIEREWARTAEDVLLRRSKLILRLSNDEIARLREFMERRCGTLARPGVREPLPA